ncbi:MAG TPA: AAA family ATPase [Saprospiraceae bacterium]|nr:AAA family ATPase [Saprospiraceae bacterium]
MALQNIPIGLQDFRKIIENDFLYVDKTEYIYKMASKPGAYFLSRPRRFGKSITIAVLQELYLGSRELFKGLWIEDKWDWGKKHPVIRISFKDINFEQRGLESPLAERMKEIAAQYGVELKTPTARDRFRELATVLAATAKVVVLIDEYDAPITHYLGKELPQAIENRDFLRGFYSVLKEADHLLEFVFLTGVSKFSKVGIFSGLNNLLDITFHPEFATMLGYTQEELEYNFENHIAATAAKMSLSKEAFLAKLKEWYNGYRFHHLAETVYNPVSLNSFFNVGDFENFWFETGTPTFLINILREQGLYKFDLEPKSQIEFGSFELDNLYPYGLLYQTGYLTIQYRDEYGLYHLDYPNYEVRNSMLAYLLDAFGGVHRGGGIVLAIKMEQAFMAHDIAKVMHILQGLFKGIPYQLYEKYPESFYHAATHLIFAYMGLRVHSEVCTSDDRADAVVETPDKVYVLEFKLDESAEAALEQIRQKRYHEAFWNLGKPVVGIGINFSSKTRNVEEWKVEEMA